MSWIKSIRGLFYVPPLSLAFFLYHSVQDVFGVIGIGTDAKQPPSMLPGSQRLLMTRTSTTTIESCTQLEKVCFDS